MSKRFEYAVVIGRFQPYHLGHAALVRQALDAADQVIMVLGSANAAPNIKNPFSPEQRENMIKAALDPQYHGRVQFTAVRDYLYDDSKWVTEVEAKVLDITGYDKSIALIGYHKDNSSYYLDLFPRFRFIHAQPKVGINATDIRRLWLQEKSFGHLVPQAVESWLDFSKISARYENLKEEYQFIETYRASWASAPYPPTFVTVDAVVIQNNHVLAVRRGDNPGRGQLALPGGFIKDTESLKAAMIRELKEETNILFPEEELISAITETKVFDHPARSLRGRTITHAFCMRLKEKSVPEIRGGDDAKSAHWIPVQDIYRREREFYEDHGSIVDYFISRL